MRKTETLNLRVSAEFKRRLVVEAAKVRRSVTNYLEATLTNLWERKGPGAYESGRENVRPKRKLR